MSTPLATLRQKVAEEMEDAWASATTAVGGAGGADLLDDALTEKDADWAYGYIGDGEAWVLLPDGPTGSGSAEERPISSISGNKLTPKRAFSAQVASGVPYEVFHVFKGRDIETALREALDLCLPHLFSKTPDTSITTVKDTYAYDISGLGFYENELYGVEIELDTTVTTAPYQRLYNWEVRDDGWLQFHGTLMEGRKLRLHGKKRLAFTGNPASVALDPPQTTILQARAIAWLAARRSAASPSQNVERWKDMEDVWMRKYQQRAATFGMLPPQGTVLWERSPILRPVR